MMLSEPQSAPVLRPSFMVWTLHWTSTLLVLYLLATSLASGLGLTKRFLPAMWMDWHLSAGVALLVLTAIRMWTSRPWIGLARVFRVGGWHSHATRSVLLFAVFAVILSGLAIFQKPPFGRTGYLFGSFPMPTLIRLDHSVHSVIIGLHIVLSCLVAGLIIAHASTGLRGGRPRIGAMLWPWRKG